MKLNPSKSVYQLGCLLLIILWATTAASKLGNLNQFKTELAKQVFSERFTAWLLIAVPASEMIAATLLAFNKTRLYGLIASLLLITAFTLYIAMVLAGYFNKVPCSCGGVLKWLGWKAHLVFNLVFTAITLTTLIIHLKREVRDKE
ncbi:MauE/DoxX family redox-associated membrane protein [Pedobacter sp. BG31]|uniref:MauE/DoxX family redox-associated membrane protein n=1 Tax=Pedobacter sp. BG31 TaxID=3349697 RepID=UPI0035F4DD92